MQRPLRSWLFVLIGIMTIIVVGSIIFLSTGVTKQTTANTPVCVTPNPGLATTTIPAKSTPPATTSKTPRLRISTIHFFQWPHTLNSTLTLQESTQANRTICGWRPEPILVSAMMLIQTPIIRAQRFILLLS